MKMLQWLSETVTSRLSTLIGGLIINKAESDALETHIDRMETIEDRARQLEADGKTELANQLRDLAKSISISSPGQCSEKISEHLSGKQTDPIRLTSGNTSKISSSEDKNKGKKRRGRPRKIQEADE